MITISLVVVSFLFIAFLPYKVQNLVAWGAQESALRSKLNITVHKTKICSSGLFYLQVFYVSNIYHSVSCIYASYPVDPA